jgi:Flp pilus assembly protein TadD
VTSTPAPEHHEAEAVDERPLIGGASEAAVPDKGADAAGSGAQEGSSAPWLVPTWVAVVALVALIAVGAWAGFAVRDTLRARREARFGASDALEAARARTIDAPHDIGARLDLAYRYMQAKEGALALTQYETVLRESPEDVAALYGQGMALLSLHRPAEAVPVLWHVLRREPGHVAAASALGDHYASVGQYKSLLVAVRPVTVIHPDEAHLQYLVGVAYEHLGHPDWAAARYRLALQANPGLPEALAGLKRLSAKP